MMTEEPEKYQRMLQSLVFRAQQVGPSLVTFLLLLFKWTNLVTLLGIRRLHANYADRKNYSDTFQLIIIIIIFCNQIFLDVVVLSV